MLPAEPALLRLSVDRVPSTLLPEERAPEEATLLIAEPSEDPLAAEPERVCDPPEPARDADAAALRGALLEAERAYPHAASHAACNGGSYGLPMGQEFAPVYVRIWQACPCRVQHQTPQRAEAEDAALRADCDAPETEETGHDTEGQAQSPPDIDRHP